MAEGYVMPKTLGYCTEYMHWFQGSSRHVWDNKEEQIMNDEVVQGSGWLHRMLKEFKAWEHNFVINNSKVFQEWRV